MFERVHKALQFLLHIIPSASHILATTVTTVFPHHTDTRRAHLVYVYNLLQITNYAQVLKSEILALITERLVKIDVQVQEDLEDLTEDVEDGVVGTISREKSKIADILDESEDSDEESDMDEDEDVEAQRTIILTKNVEKMDSILDMLFSFYDQTFSIAPTNDQSSAMDILLSQFQTIILPAYRSRHIQFLLFHFVQKSAVYIDTFVGLCAQTSFDKTRPALVRQAAAAYLASFVARGIHVPPSIVRDVWDYISTELKRLHKQQEPTCRGPHPTRYASYYSLVQALLYIFCFRWQDLQVDPDEVFDDGDLPSIYSEERQWRPGVKETLQLHLFSKLNPLKLCSPAIVNEFARITHHMSVIYVFHLLETNKRIRLSNFSGAQGYAQINRETALSAMKEEYQHLAEYFPFDPYHLPQSKRWIEADYREWKGIPGLDGEKPVDSDSDGEEQEKSDFKEDTDTDEDDD